MNAPRRYPAPRTTSPADAARLSAWRLAQRTRTSLAPIAVCTCGCGFPSTACRGAL